MQMKENYQIILNKTLENIIRDGLKPQLLLHACCAPCSSYVLEYLSEYFEITVFFYNPNITEREEYDKRAEEIKRLISELPHKNQIHLLYGKYDPESFFEISKGLENLPEGGERCFGCYRLRLNEAAIAAKAGGFDYFTTTLSISPHKNAGKLNEIGKELSEKYDIPYLFSDFKKKNGYKRSCELSAVYGLYRQSYCGCIFSKAAAAADGRLLT
ncbi:MAG: epoxyqueuosine reductase QueH [Oscillospiraceae bacterium]|nr:epoxyqueuosine reductase QueH [Oscillospiraceae bacterium]